VFLLILGAVLGLMHLYLWKRLVKDATRGRARWLLSAVVVALAVLLIATLALGMDEPSWLAWPGYLWFGLVFYLVLTLLVLEPILLALRRWTTRTPPVLDDAPGMDRRMFLARTGALAAGAASVALVGVGASTALGPPDVLRIPVALRRLHPAFNGFRIAVVSDIHLGPLAGRAHTERIVRMINDTEPDLVAIVGDLVDGTVAQLGAAAEPLRDLVSRGGAFFVTGNHEYFVTDTGAWLRELERFGVHPLHNANTVIRRGSSALTIAGVNDVSGARHSDPPDYDRALTGAAGSTILLAHQPIQVAESAARGVDLQVSGHTHGGQMWPFHYLVRATQPTLAGLSSVGDTQLYVTRGAGFWGPPVRVGARPDITVLSLGCQPTANNSS
jgi:predicted MPP superfamily phosphohydrolase